MQACSAAETWAKSAFGKVNLGDSRRTARLVRCVARAFEKPSGKLCETFARAKELGSAYDFVENPKVCIRQLEEGVGLVTVAACARTERVRIAVDGSSAQVVDRTGKKGLGRIGADSKPTRGVKVMTALAIDARGTTVGILAQSFWARANASNAKKSLARKHDERNRKSPQQKETHHWLDVISRSAKRLAASGVLGWFQLDREGDAWPMLQTLAKSNHWFTVRSAWDRVVQGTGRDRHHLRADLAARPTIGSYELNVPAGKKRTARLARMLVRVATVTLVLRDKCKRKTFTLCVNVVWVQEQGTTPRGEKPVDWMLLTNAPIDTVGRAFDVVAGYAMRWRIEEFHKTWKSGACNVEDTQLRSRNAIIRWATILGVVAARIERLKRLSRTEPDRPASDELTETEIEVLIALKRSYKKRTETVPNGMPSMAQAVRWIADLGGYTGKSSGGPPGSIVLTRGMLHLAAAVDGVLAMRRSRK